MMEGIAGVVGSRDRQLVRKMLKRLEHRGADVVDIHEDDALTLGARSAKWSQKARGMAIAEEGGLAVASDSYIFNKEELCGKYFDRSRGRAHDAELLLAMYRELGPAMFGQLDGAFAVAVMDGGRLILARDRYGLKPLYISLGDKAAVFSSEMKSQAVAKDDFVPFPPGRIRLPSGEFVPIRHKVPGRRKRQGPGNSSRAIREETIDSVRRSFAGTIGFNILLSGGIDSSVVAAAAAEVTDDIRSVCVGQEDSADILSARKVAERLGTDHKEYMFGIEEMVERLDEVICAAESFDYPLVRSCIPNYMATHLFTDTRRVTLCGEGGDEVFAGYDYMRDIKGDDALRLVRMELLRKGHLTGFQRVDRMTASAHLDGRMPLMSGRVIELGLSLGREDLIGPRPQDSKVALRKAFRGLLPADIVSRRKQRFSDGAGSMHTLVDFAERLISDKEFEKEKKMLPKGRIRTKEELLYYRVFAEHFDSPSAMAAVGFTARP